MGMGHFLVASGGENRMEVSVHIALLSLRSCLMSTGYRGGVVLDC